MIIIIIFGEVMRDAPYIFFRRDGRKKMPRPFCNVFLYICNILVQLFI
jgi:hypothetical protein